MNGKYTLSKAGHTLDDFKPKIGPNLLPKTKNVLQFCGVSLNILPLPIELKQHLLSCSPRWADSDGSPTKASDREASIARCSVFSHLQTRHQRQTTTEIKQSTEKEDKLVQLWQRKQGFHLYSFSTFLFFSAKQHLITSLRSFEITTSALLLRMAGVWSVLGNNSFVCGARCFGFFIQDLVIVSCVASMSSNYVIGNIFNATYSKICCLYSHPLVFL